MVQTTKKSLKDKLKHAFSVKADNDETVFTKEDIAVVDIIAKKVVKFGMVTPALLFLESSRPMSYLGSQVLIFLEPFVRGFSDSPNYNRFAQMMQNRKGVCVLMDRIEFFENEKTNKKGVTK